MATQGTSQPGRQRRGCKSSSSSASIEKNGVGGLDVQSDRGDDAGEEDGEVVGDESGDVEGVEQGRES